MSNIVVLWFKNAQSLTRQNFNEKNVKGFKCSFSSNLFTPLSTYSIHLAYKYCPTSDMLVSTPGRESFPGVA